MLAASTSAVAFGVVETTWSRQPSGRSIGCPRGTAFSRVDPSAERGDGAGAVATGMGASAGGAGVGAIGGAGAGGAGVGAIAGAGDAGLLTAGTATARQTSAQPTFVHLSFFPRASPATLPFGLQVWPARAFFATVAPGLATAMLLAPSTPSE